MGNVVNISTGGECDYENRVFSEDVASNFVNFGYLCNELTGCINCREFLY